MLLVNRLLFSNDVLPLSISVIDITIKEIIPAPNIILRPKHTNDINPSPIVKKIPTPIFSTSAIAFLVAVIGFTLAVGSGTLIAGRVGEEVLNYQVEFSGLSEEVEDDYNYISNWDDNYFTEVTLSDMVDAYEVQISPLIIGEIYVAGLGIVLISILIPSLMIMRYNPKKILMSAQ